MGFPVIDAFLLCPEEGKSGKVAVCTNMLAPGMVSNEIPFELRSDVAVMGSLVVNRDGAERMIINALAHPSLEYVILFGQETLSFSLLWASGSEGEIFLPKGQAWSLSWGGS